MKMPVSPHVEFGEGEFFLVFTLPAADGAGDVELYRIPVSLSAEEQARLPNATA